MLGPIHGLLLLLLLGIGALLLPVALLLHLLLAIVVGALRPRLRGPGLFRVSAVPAHMTPRPRQLLLLLLLLTLQLHTLLLVLLFQGLLLRATLRPIRIANLRGTARLCPNVPRARVRHWLLLELPLALLVLLLLTHLYIAWIPVRAV